jgi:hypothetical protein
VMSWITASNLPSSHRCNTFSMCLLKSEDMVQFKPYLRS